MLWFAINSSLRTLCDTLVERNEKEMKIRKIIFCLITISIFYSCSTSKISESEISKINGTFEANSSDGNTHNNLVSLLNRKLLTDTLVDKPINMYKLELKIIDKKHIEISTISEENKILNKKTYKFKKKNEYIILKNQNTKPILIPYVAGALDVTKLKFKTDKNKNLTVLISHHRSGGAFLIPMGWSNEKKIETFKRIE